MFLSIYLREPYQVKWKCHTSIIQLSKVNMGRRPLYMFLSIKYLIFQFNFSQQYIRFSLKLTENNLKSNPK